MLRSDVFRDGGREVDELLIPDSDDDDNEREKRPKISLLLSSSWRRC